MVVVLRTWVCLVSLTNILSLPIHKMYTFLRMVLTLDRPGLPWAGLTQKSPTPLTILQLQTSDLSLLILHPLRVLTELQAPREQLEM